MGLAHRVGLGRRRQLLTQFGADVVTAYGRACRAATVNFSGSVTDGRSDAGEAMLMIAARLVILGPDWLAVCQHCHRIILRLHLTPDQPATWRHTDIPNYPVTCHLPHAAIRYQATPAPTEDPAR